MQEYKKGRGKKLLAKGREEKEKSVPVCRLMLKLSRCMEWDK